MMDMSDVIQDKEKLSDTLLRLILGGFISFIVCYVWLACSPLVSEASIEYAKENNFIWYLNGREVDPELLILDEYKLKFDEENERVLLTHRD